MEQETVNCQDLSYLINSLTSHNIHNILSFLDSDTIINIIQAQTQQSNKKYIFIEIARLRHFIQTYLNKTDRSVYMPFYSQPLFLKMEHEQISYLCTHSASGLSFLSDAFKQLFKILQNQLQDFQMSNEAVESITGSLTDPELPFPKLRKQSIGMHCNSSFQYFLVDKLFANNDGEEMEETFEQLSKFLNERWNLQSQNQKKQIQIIQEVFTSWFKIGYQNYQSFLIPNNINHNLVVIILALIDLLIDSFTFYIESIHDPLYSFIQFNMRYCIFRNVIMSLEEKLGFLFKNYSSFYAQIIERKSVLMVEEESQKGKLRQMTIWHCGLSKWYIYMQRQHQQYFKMFFFLLRKINIQTLKNSNEEKLQQCGIYIELQNRIDLNEINLLERQQNFEVYSPLEDIFQENGQFYNQLIKQYIQYVVDISINQYSVHWCGHSNQVLHIPYQQFQNLLTQHFKTYLSKVVQIAKQVSDPVVAIDSILKSILYQLDRQYLKPVTLSKIVKLMEEETIILIGQEKYQSTELIQLIKQIQSDFARKDKILNHFNESANISNQISYKYSIVLESQDFNKALKTSASTNTSRNSQGDAMHCHLHLRSSKSINYQDFP